MGADQERHERFAQGIHAQVFEPKGTTAKLVAIASHLPEGHESREWLKDIARQLEQVRKALEEARPYVYGVTFEQQPWRAETAADVLKRIDTALHQEGAEHG